MEIKDWHREFVLWERWLAANVYRSAAPTKQENASPQLSDNEKEDDTMPDWPVNMPYGC